MISYEYHGEKKQRLLIHLIYSLKTLSLLDHAKKETPSPLPSRFDTSSVITTSTNDQAGSVGLLAFLSFPPVIVLKFQEVALLSDDCPIISTNSRL